MNSYLKLISGIVGLAAICRALVAADATTYTTYATKTYSPATYSASNSVAASSSNGVVLALNGQALLLGEMLQEHQKRAADLSQTNQTEKAKWESDLVNELQEKSARVQKSIDQATQPWPGTNDLKGATDIDEPLVFVSTVEAHLEQLRQELSAAIEESHVLSVQIGTNRAPEDFAGLSFALSENQRVVKQLQREQLDLELRRLEFRAIWKAIRK
jgi:hypothetical protein